MLRNSGYHKTPEEHLESDAGASSGELTREEIRSKIKIMSKKIASLRKKKRALKITPTRLDFQKEDDGNGDFDLEKEADPG